MNEKIQIGKNCQVISVFQPFVLPASGFISLKKLADYVGIKKVRNLVNVLPEGAVIIPKGKLSNSMINLEDLKKCITTIRSLKTPPSSIINEKIDDSQLGTG
jgi:hypothetical protein